MIIIWQHEILVFIGVLLVSSGKFIHLSLGPTIKTIVFI